MRRDYVKKVVKDCIEHPCTQDIIGVPDVDFTPEEWDYFEKLVKEENDKLTEWYQWGSNIHERNNQCTRSTSTQGFDGFNCNGSKLAQC